MGGLRGRSFRGNKERRAAPGEARAFPLRKPYLPSLLAAPLAGSLPPTHGPASFWYSGGTTTLPASPPFQPMTWLGLPWSLLRFSQRLAQLASASTGLRFSLSQNRARPWR